MTKVKELKSYDPIVTVYFCAHGKQRVSKL